MSRSLTGLYDGIPRRDVIRDLLARSRRRLKALGNSDLDHILENALWHERKRLEKDPDEEVSHKLDRLARALVRGDRATKIDSGLALVEGWADEIHGRFDRRVYKFATGFLPQTLTALLSGRPKRWRDFDLSPQTRIKVEGDLELLRTLALESTLILAPTHVSNLDSPLIGMALHLAGLPPFVYGAGLNLFDNAVMGWWMHRLGAYTVDRKKKADLYKLVLKDYSVRCLTTRHHSLFFPGGTRSRSGKLETHLKKGLLGTGIVAWQEMLEAKRSDPEVYTIPVTLSFTLTLEASTLIDDSLAESGKQRYIITDDEFAQPRRLASFARRVLDLDSAITVHFGTPLDCLGHKVSANKRERTQQAINRRRYVTDASGKVEWDAQRDRVYTDRLAKAITQAYPTLAVPLSTNIAAYAAWRILERQLGTTDIFRIVRVPEPKRRMSIEAFDHEVSTILDRLTQLHKAGVAQAPPIRDPAAIREHALDHFARYHRSRALADIRGELSVQDPRLCLYYRNRLLWLDQEVN